MSSSCYKMDNGKWVGSDEANEQLCVTAGGKWTGVSDVLSVKEVSTCDSLSPWTFFSCSVQSIKGTYHDFRDWNKGSGTRISTPPSSADAAPDETLKRSRNIVTQNNRHYYIGILLALLVLLSIFVVRRLT